MNVGADFSATFNVVDTSNTGFNFSTTNSVGLGTYCDWLDRIISDDKKHSDWIYCFSSAATFTVSIDTTASSGYGLTISLGSTDTRSVKSRSICV